MTPPPASLSPSVSAAAEWWRMKVCHQVTWKWHHSQWEGRLGTWLVLMGENVKWMVLHDYNNDTQRHKRLDQKCHLY